MTKRIMMQAEPAAAPDQIPALLKRASETASELWGKYAPHLIALKCDVRRAPSIKPLPGAATISLAPGGVVNLGTEALRKYPQQMISNVIPTYISKYAAMHLMYQRGEQPTINVPKADLLQVLSWAGLEALAKRRRISRPKNDWLYTCDECGAQRYYKVSGTPNPNGRACPDCSGPMLPEGHEEIAFAKQMREEGEGLTTEVPNAGAKEVPYRCGSCEKTTWVSQNRHRKIWHEEDAGMCSCGDELEPVSKRYLRGADLARAERAGIK